MLIYDELAPWWPLLSSPAEYAEEVATFRPLFDEGPGPRPRTMLELGSGGGNNAWHLKAHYALTLVEPAAGMLAESVKLNPECEHVQGDMRTVRLASAFDAVFVHDAVMYMTTEADLRAAMTTAFVHCRPGGVALFVPDCVRETFEPETSHGGSDGADGRGLRYLEWSTDPDPADTTYDVDFALLMRDANGTVRSAHDHHVEGVFAREVWLRLLRETGFTPRAVMDAWGRDLFVCHTAIPMPVT